MSDAELRTEYNEIAKTTFVGLDWYREEFRRRDAKRQGTVLIWLTPVIALLTVANTAFVVYAVLSD
jgi:hypothetical protein